MSELPEKNNAQNDQALSGQIDTLVMMQVLDEIKQWDIKNKMQQGQYLLPLRLRRRLQQALGEL